MHARSARVCMCIVRLLPSPRKGALLSLLSPQVCDPLVTGAVPRLAAATICVPLQTRGGALTAIAPFYMSTRGGMNARVVVPRHHGIPRLGWVGSGKRLSCELRGHRLAIPLLNLMRVFTCTTYDGAAS